MAVTFQLCEVPRATKPLPEVPVEAAVQELLGTPVEACGAGVRGLVAVQANAFVGAAWRAFAEHRPLVLGPDAVWLCIAQGFAMHVDLHAEALRGRFVRHEGKAKLLVRRDDFLKGSPTTRGPRCSPSSRGRSPGTSVASATSSSATSRRPARSSAPPRALGGPRVR